jgi:Mn2+/Fe2+ NRAMP family transporter
MRYLKLFWTLGGGFVAVVLVICTTISLCFGKFKNRRLLIASTICSVVLSAPLIYAWMLVREHYATVTDHSAELTAMMVAYLAALAISLIGPIAQHLLRANAMARETPK